MVYKFDMYDNVQKKSGYKFPGYIIARFLEPQTEEPRYVVYCTAPEVYGCMHIFNEGQLISLQP